MGKLSLKDLQAYVDGAVTALGERVDTCCADVNLQQATIEPDDFSDIRFRSEAVKEATLRVKVIFPEGAEVNGDYVDEVLKVASFLVGEPYANTNVTNYNDNYYYGSPAA